MRKLIVLLAFACLSLASHPVFADAIGTSVTGSLTFNGAGPTNYFLVSNGSVPPGYGNSISDPTTIGSGIEFGYVDFFNTNTADFTGSTLTVQDVSSFADGAFEMDFTDTYFTGVTLLAGSNPGFTYSFSGNTLQVFFAGTSTPGTYAASFTLAGGTDTPPNNPGDPAVTPEPSTIFTLGTGLLAAVGAGRRKLLAR